MSSSVASESVNNETGILRHASSFDGQQSLTRPRSISFADEHGEELVENTYSKQLYYGTSGTAIRRTSDSGSCCVLS